MPENIIDLLPMLFLLVAAGALAGFIAGLLGVGGGIVTIPVLFLMFEAMDIGGAWRMHMAVATSLAIIITTNISSVRAHHRKGGVVWMVVKKWWVPLVLGSVLGTMFAKQLKTEELVYFFVALAVIMGIKMLLPLENKTLGKQLPDGLKTYVSPAVIGFFSTIMGIGGGSFSVPYLTLYSVPIHRAVGTASLAGLVISIAGGISYLIGGLNIEGLPEYSLGFIYTPAFVIVAPIAMLMAPVGANVAHRIPQRALSITFGLFLIIATSRMLYAVMS